MTIFCASSGAIAGITLACLAVCVLTGVAVCIGARACGFHAWCKTKGWCKVSQ